MRWNMENNLQNEMNKLCDMQIELWNDLKNALEATNNATEEEICVMFSKHLRETHHEAVLQLVKVKIAIDKVDG